MKGIAESVAFLDLALYSETTRNLVVATIDQFEAETTKTNGSTSAASKSLTWQRLELALYLLYGFGSFSFFLSRAALDPTDDCPHQ